MCKKNYSFKRVVFFQTKIANSFYSKINDSSRLRTTRFSSSRFGARVTVMPNIFTIYPQHFLIPEISETLKGSPTKIFGTVRQKIVILPPPTPPLIHKFFRYQKFCETEGTPYEVFRSCETKNFRQNHDAPLPSYT